MLATLPDEHAIKTCTKSLAPQVFWFVCLTNKHTHMYVHINTRTMFSGIYASRQVAHAPSLFLQHCFVLRQGPVDTTPTLPRGQPTSANSPSRRKNLGTCDLQQGSRTERSTPASGGGNPTFQEEICTAECGQCLHPATKKPKPPHLRRGLGTRSLFEHNKCLVLVERCWIRV